MFSATENMKKSNTFYKFVISNMNSYFKNMETIAIHPKNKEQLNALKALLKDFKIPFEKFEPYDPNFVEKIKVSEKNESRAVVLKSDKDIDDFFTNL